MNSEESFQPIEKLSTGGRSSDQDWTVCRVCRGGGRRRRRPSPRVLRRYQRALRDAGPSDDPPKPPKDHVDDCVACRGSGLEEADACPSPDARFPTVAVVGGGIGGLALGVACRHRGIPCTVFERDAHFDQRAQGYGLTMQQASKALEGFGIYDLTGGLTSTKHVVHDAEGRLLGSWGLRKWGRSPLKSEPRRRNVHIPRQALRRTLLEALGGHDAVQWNHRLMDFEEAEDAVTLRFQTGGGYPAAPGRPPGRGRRNSFGGTAAMDRRRALSASLPGLHRHSGDLSPGASAALRPA